MKVRRMKKAVALATGIALALSFPAVGAADKGGVPHSQKPCPAKGKKNTKKPAPNDKGKKCGFATNGGD
ncbi:MAG: hypothetical protein ACRDL6_05450 [Solirubrobacterales bacterium]